jgi:peptidoglycan hydrolase-like protein with peptidoglycan-binding domain
VSQVDPDKNPIKKILEDSQTSAFPEADRDVFEAIASYHDVPYLAGSKPEVWNGQEKTADVGEWIRDNIGKPLENAINPPEYNVTDPVKRGEDYEGTASMSPKEWNATYYQTHDGTDPNKYTESGQFATSENDPTQACIDTSNPDFMKLVADRLQTADPKLFDQYLPQNLTGNDVILNDWAAQHPMAQAMAESLNGSEAAKALYKPNTDVQGFNPQDIYEHPENYGFKNESSIRESISIDEAETNLENKWHDQVSPLDSSGLAKETPTPTPTVVNPADAVYNYNGYLQNGDSGAEVKAIQQRLGFKGDDLDGVYGPQTQAAVEAYQNQWNNTHQNAEGFKPIGVDGVVGQQTAKAIFDPGKQIPAPGPLPMGGDNKQVPAPTRAPDTPINGLPKGSGAEDMHKKAYGWGDFGGDLLQAVDPATGFGLNSIGDRARFLQDQVGLPQGESFLGGPSLHQMFGWGEDKNAPKSDQPSFGPTDSIEVPKNATPAEIAATEKAMDEVYQGGGPSNQSDTSTPSSDQVDGEIAGMEWINTPLRDIPNPGATMADVAQDLTNNPSAQPSGSGSAFNNFKPGEPLYSIGDTGNQVKQIQKLIGADQDGVFGQQTQQALMDWQQKNNLQVDGDFGAQSLAAAQGNANASNVAPGVMKVSYFVTAAGEEPTPEELDAIRREEEAADPGVGGFKVGPGATGVTPAEGSGVNPNLKKWQTPQALESEGQSVRPREFQGEGELAGGGASPEYAQTGGSNPYTFQNVVSPQNNGTDSFTVKMTAGPVDVKIDRSGSIVAIDGVDAASADQLNPVQLAAVAILQNQAAKAKFPLALGQFGSVISQAMGNPEFNQQVSDSIGIGPTASRTVSETGDRNVGNQDSGIDKDLDFNSFLERQIATDHQEGKMPVGSLAELRQVLQEAGPAAIRAAASNDEEFASFPPEQQEQLRPIRNMLTLYNTYKDIFNKNMPAETTESSPSLGDISVAASVHEALSSQPVVNPVPLSEEQGYPVETIEEQLEGAPSAVGHGEPKEAAQGKHDHPSPKAAEAVFKALEENNHEAAHELMGHTDCPMDCETENEGVCRHGYMSAGRTRVVFLDTDLRRGGSVHQSESLKDIYDTFSNPLTAFTGEQIAANPALTHLLPNPEGRANYFGPSIDEFKVPGILPGTETTQAISSTREADFLGDVWDTAKGIATSPYNPVTHPLTAGPELGWDAIQGAGKALGENVFAPTWNALTTPESNENLGEWSDATKQFQKSLQDQYDANQKAPMPAAPDGKLTVPGYDQNGNPLPQN